MESKHVLGALRLAARGRYRCSPNPMVGAVLVRDGEVLATGYHRQVGGDHAEVEALRKVGGQAPGATLFVTLEPCIHQGRTPPCVPAVVEAGIKRLVTCHQDPDPRIAGRGLEALRSAGVEVEVGLLREQALRMNLHYLTATIHRRPAVTLKWAMSLDGRIATVFGESQWISSPAGRRWGLQLREEHDAVLVGSGTLLADNPRLDRRLNLARRPNLRAVLDRRLRIPRDARLFASPGPVLVYTESRDRARAKALEESKATVVVLPSVEPATVLEDLFGRGVHSVLVEGGGEMLAAFAEAGLFDRVMVDCSPLLIGGQGAPGPIGGVGIKLLGDAARLEELTIRRRGEDAILTAYREGCLRALSQSAAV